MGEGKGSVRTAKGQRVSRRDAARDLGAPAPSMCRSSDEQLVPRGGEHSVRLEPRLVGRPGWRGPRALLVVQVEVVPIV
eukprot:scaffold188_cov107-Isochrysis_galbana.AAC.17